MQDHVTTNWNTGRGRKTVFEGKEDLFMLLTWLENGGKWDYMCGFFRIEGSVFQRLMKSFVVFVSPFLYDTQVTRITIRQFSSLGKLLMYHL